LDPNRRFRGKISPFRFRFSGPIGWHFSSQTNFLKKCKKDLDALSDFSLQTSSHDVRTFVHSADCFREFSQNSKDNTMKKQNSSIKAHLLWSALILLSLLAVCAIPFALAQSRNRGTRQSGKQSRQVQR